MIETPEPGVYRDIPMELYLQWDAVGSSTLEDMRRTPSYCAWRRANPETEPDSAERRLGTAIHCAVLEPHHFEARYVLDPISPKFHAGEVSVHYPKGWRNTKEYKDRAKALAERGLTVLPQSDIDACRWVADNIAKHAAARDLVSVAHSFESSWVTIDDDTGLKLKARPDLLAGDVICHLKTTKNAMPEAFDRDVYFYGYHRMAAFYNYVIGMESEIQTTLPRSVFLVIENTPPYDVAVRALEPAALDLGEIEYRALLEQFWACKEQTRWHGYSEKIEPCGIPKWAYYQDEE